MNMDLAVPPQGTEYADATQRQLPTRSRKQMMSFLRHLPSLPTGCSVRLAQLWTEARAARGED